jgi:hypothetical protein
MRREYPFHAGNKEDDTNHALALDHVDVTDLETVHTAQYKGVTAQHIAS